MPGKDIYKDDFLFYLIVDFPAATCPEYFNLINCHIR